jgi:hypothetical protein
LSPLAFPASAAGFEDSPGVEGGKLALAGKYPSRKYCSPGCTGNADPGGGGDNANKLCGESGTSNGVERGDAWALCSVPACEELPKQNTKALASF